MKLKTKFQDEDFDLGEVVNANIYYGGSDRIKIIVTPKRGGEYSFYCDSLKELSEMFEDYEEPKEHWCITMYGGITRIKDDEEPIEDLIEIGNYFNSKEDAYDAWDKLKAWKRLKDKGFRFVEWQQHGITEDDVMDGAIYFEDAKNIDRADLDLLFGGEK